MKLLTNKIVLTTAFIIGLMLCNGQNLKIYVENWEPRIGQEINLIIGTNFIDNYLKEELKDSIEFVRPTSKNLLIKTFIAKRKGPMTIGPLRFEFNGVEMISDKITINIIDALPREEGVWLRKLIMNGSEFIVVEQNVLQHPQDISNGGANVWNDKWKIMQEMLTSLKEYTEDDNLSFYLYNSLINLADKKVDGKEAKLIRSIKFYEIRRKPDFEGSFRLKTGDFERLPEGTIIPNIIIN